MDPRYEITVGWSEEEEAWVARVPALNSCAGFGETPEEARAQAQRVMAALLEGAKAAGVDLPDPASVEEPER
ncbi:MAG: type II toxin-antitoxin system HicB family antitoxin [Rhodothalassiaceae bacterium]